MACSVKMAGQDGWILVSFFFCEFMDLDFVSVHKHAKKELGQYPDILTSHLVNKPYILYSVSTEISSKTLHTSSVKNIYCYMSTKSQVMFESYPLY